MANLPSQRLAAWFAGAQGSRLLREEAPRLAEAARRFHGDTLLWVGCHEEISRNVRGCMVRNRLFASEALNAPSDDLSGIRCALESLPLPNCSLDAMILHHSLETASDPRSALREAARVLVPGGRLVICAFNPWSLWGLRIGYGHLREDAFSGLKLVSRFRLLDWLALLGFELQNRVQYLSYAVPLTPAAGADVDDAAVPAHRGRVHRLLMRYQPPLGGVYLICAVKQAAAMRPRWEAVKAQGAKLAPAAYPKSAVSKVRSSADPRATGAKILPLRAPRNWKSFERPG